MSTENYERNPHPEKEVVECLILEKTKRVKCPVCKYTCHFDCFLDDNLTGFVIVCRNCKQEFRHTKLLLPGNEKKFAKFLVHFSIKYNNPWKKIRLKRITT